MLTKVLLLALASIASATTYKATFTEYALFALPSVTSTSLTPFPFLDTAPETRTARQTATQLLQRVAGTTTLVTMLPLLKLFLVLVPVPEPVLAAELAGSSLPKPIRAVMNYLERRVLSQRSTICAQPMETHCALSRRWRIRTNTVSHSSYEYYRRSFLVPRGK